MRKTNKRRLAAAGILLSIAMFGSAGCGKAGDSGAGKAAVSGNTEKANTEEAAEANQDTEGADAEGTEARELTYGNHPNNLFQNEYTPCFGGGRIYYANLDYQLCSAALDGSDFKVLGALGEPGEFEQGSPKYLNYYKDSVYFMLTVYEKDGTRSVDIRRFDLTSGAVETVKTIKNGDFTTGNGMLILGDDVIYSVLEPRESITVGALSLTSGENATVAKKSKQAGATNMAMDTDGTYLYLMWNASVPSLSRVPLAQLYEAEPENEELLPVINYAQAAVFDDGGIYAVYQDSDSHKNDYCFYRYENAGPEWKFETLAADIESSEPDTEEAIVRNLIYVTNGYILDGARASRQNEVLYYAPSLDYTQSLRAAELVFDKNAERKSGCYVGEYEDTLYALTETEEEASLHALTSDGVYQ